MSKEIQQTKSEFHDKKRREKYLEKKKILSLKYLKDKINRDR